MRASPMVVIALSALAGCRAKSPAPLLPDEWTLRSVRVDTARGAAAAMISSNDSLATLAGLGILERGGNAVDAAVAVGYALAVTYPEAGNIGGGGFMLIRMADGRRAAIDFREVAPLGATRDMYVDAAGDATDRGRVGHLASGVPGTVAGLSAALERHGTMTLADVMQPAIRLASEGFRVDSAMHRSLVSNAGRIMPYAGAALFYPNGEPLAEGALLVQPDLARTLRAIAARGPSGFYSGEVADSLVAEMRRGGGLITHQDLAGYRPLWREPLVGTYRGRTLLTMPPSSSGGVTMLETLAILEALGPLPPFGSTAWAHRVSEALRRAFLDRNDQLGDPAFVDNPVARLTSEEYARVLARSIDPARASVSLALAEARAKARAEGTETTHFSVVDRHGNVVSTTYTINDIWGSGVWVRGAGFFLNDEMDDFSARPGKPNQFGLVQGERNAIAPGKRMLSSMTPTIVLDASGAPLLIIGSRGGPRIITSTLLVISNVIDQGMSLPDAMAAPRIHHQALPDSLRYEAGGLAQAVLDSLRAMGHAVGPAPWAPGGYSGRVHAVMRMGDGWIGVVDPRTSGLAKGVE
jgi:gamma-glutamyltranspeptidase/glutathione hydrolase